MIPSSSDKYINGSRRHKSTDWVQRAILNSQNDRCTPVEESKPPRKRSRGWTKRTKMPFNSSMFYRDYHNPNVKVVEHTEAKEFRRDYRMPWVEVEKIVSLFVRMKWVATDDYTEKTSWIVGRHVCPPEIKILATLYWLGEGCSFRTIRNLSNRVLSRQSFTNFTKTFCRLIAKHLGPQWIRVPKDLSELRRVSAVYERLGFPGCVGSTDGVQIAWEGCPYAYRSSFTGKEKYPTLGFNVTVDHELRILHVCSMFAGRFNDKTKVLYDDYVSKLRQGFYEGFSYNILDAGGARHRCTIPYLLCDNGYHRWLQLMCPFKTTSQVMLAIWSKQLESKRKDAERVFGVIKKRFRILKVPLQFRDATFIEHIFITCAVLHNKLLTHDKQFKDGSFHRGVSPRIPQQQRRTILINNVRKLLRADSDYSFMNQGDVTEDCTTQVDSEFLSMRKRLAEHLYTLYVNKQLEF